MNTKQHRDGWMEIAEAYGTPEHKRGQSEIGLTATGLCFAVFGVWGAIEASRLTSITDPLAACGWDRDYVWPIPDDESRCLFACLMAAMTREEYEDFVS